MSLDTPAPNSGYGSLFTDAFRHAGLDLPRRTGNLRAVQLLLGHAKIESTVRYLGIEIDDAIEIAEKIEV